MTHAERFSKIKKLIFGTNGPLPLQRRIHILLTFFVSIILTTGFIFTIVIDFHISLTIMAACAGLVMVTFYLIARNREDYQWSVMPLYVISTILLGIGWLMNGGYDGNITTLIMIFFQMQYFLVKPQHRKLIFVVLLMMNSALISIQYFFPHLVMGYASEQQRFIDMLVSYALYFVLFYLFVDAIMTTHSEENFKIHQVNDELQGKNAEIAVSMQLLEASERRFRELYTLNRLMSDTVPDLIWAKDLEGRYIFANTAMCTTLLKAADTNEAIGKTDLFFAERERNSRPGDPEWHTFGEQCQETDEETVRSLKEMQFFEAGFVRGKYLSLDVRKTPLYDAVGNLIGIIGSARDITERMKQEELLKASEERQRFILESMPVAIYSSPVDPNKDTIWIGGDVKKVTGFEVSEYLAADDFWRNRLHPEDRERVIGSFAAATWSDDLNIEYRWMCKDGTYHWFQDRSRLITNRERVEFHGIIIDITDRKESERKQAETEGRYRAMVENLHQAYYEGDARAVFTYCNPELFFLTGYSEEELIGTNALRLIAEEDRSRVSQSYYQWKKERRLTSSIEFRARKKNGELFWAEQTTHFEFDRDGKFLKGANIVKNIQDRKAAELALQRSEEEYRSVFHSVPVAIYKEYYPELDRYITRLRAEGVTDFKAYFTERYDELAVVMMTGNITDVNDHALRLLEAKSKEELYSNIRRMFLPETYRSVTSMVAAYADRRSSYSDEVQVQTLRGNTLTVVFSSSFLKDADQELFFLISFQDITDRKQMEVALRRSEVFFRSVWEHSASGMRITDEKGTIIRVNDAYCRMVGKTEQELVGANFSVIYKMNEREGIVRKHWERFADRSVPHFMERRLTLWNGAAVWFEVSNSFLDLTGGLTLLLGVFTDVTERKNSEQIIRDIQRRESIGVLAGGIAHDFNNLLTAIIGNITLAGMKLPEEHPVRVNLKRAVTASERAALLAKQMLAYSGKGRFQIAAVDLTKMVLENVNLLEASLPKNVAIRTDFATTPVVVNGDPGQLEQIVMNLIINAGEAVGERHGQIDITVSSLTMTGEALRPYGILHAQHLAPGPYAFLQVADNGDGMSPETMAKIFDPFFTTKFVGRGLGLSAVLGIIRGHNGGIKVNSAVNEGTVFQIVLPLRTEKEPAAEPVQQIQRRSLSILMIDDEQYIIDMAKDVLESGGHRCSIESDPVRGIERFRGASGDTDLVILDYSMPKLNGKEVLMELRAIAPDVPVIMSSGFSEEELDHLMGDVKPDAFLQKPHRPDALLSLIDQVFSRLTR